ncbi:MAG: SLBB domain-containing protein [Armatimonadota bacterium]|nr:SLBB domain-containing protein [Armatimonadota bacterium]
MKVVVGLVLGLLLLLPGLAQAEEYTLDTGDVITVVVLRHEQFSGEFTVPPSGRVVFPGIGELTVRGLTLAELSAQLRGHLSKRLRNPEVFVSLKQARPQLVFVEGWVNRPGAYPIQPNWRVAEAIAAAEGLKIPPERAIATLIRGEQTFAIDLAALLHRGDQRTNYLLRPGDLLSIQQKPTVRVAVVGEVAKPGTYDLEEGTRVLQAIAAAEGLTPFAALQRAFIDRGGTVIPVDLYQALAQGEVTSATNPPLQNGDVVVVPRNMRRYAIVGQVAQPGYYTIPEGKPFLLADAIAQAGGMNPRAITSRVTILRFEGDKIIRLSVPYQRFLKRGDLEANPPIRDGDVIYLAEAKRVELGEILGAVSILSVAQQLGWIR